MKQPLMLGTALQQFHWETLTNLHLEVCYYRHRLIQTVNSKIASNELPQIEELDRLAQVDELVNAAAERLEAAKAVLFDLCYKET